MRKHEKEYFNSMPSLSTLVMKKSMVQITRENICHYKTPGVLQLRPASEHGIPSSPQ
jgi:hypothetical protein